MALPRRLRLLPLALAVAAGGCGGDGGGAFRIGDLAGKPNATDAAFVRAMVPQHHGALSAHGLARERAARRELRELARDALPARRRELGELTAAASLDGVRPRGRGMGDHVVRIDPRGLRRSVSFDHGFLRTMIRHHEGTIVMAELEQERGGDPRLKRLAGVIRAAHQRDLEALRRFLHTWYGEAPVPGDEDEGGGGGGSGDPPL